MYAERILQSLILKAYRAASGSAGWSDFLVAFGTALDSHQVTLFLHDPSVCQGSIEASAGFDPKVIRSYNEYYASRNVWLRGGSKLLRPGLVRSSEMMCSRQEFLRSEWCADFCKPLNISRGIGATLLKERGVTCNIAVFADERRACRDEEDFALVRALMPHLQMALRLRMHLAASMAREHALEAVLNGMAKPAIVVAASAEVLFLNAAAERLIGAADGLMVERGALRAIVPRDTVLLRRLIAGTAQPRSGMTLGNARGQGCGGTLLLPSRCGHGTLEVAISTLLPREEDRLLSRLPAAVVIVTGRTATERSDAPWVHRHGLTTQESRVAAAVFNGLTSEEICRTLGISYNTLKTHLRHLYSKTRTRHRSDLVRVLAEGVYAAGPAAGWSRPAAVSGDGGAAPARSPPP